MEELESRALLAAAEFTIALYEDVAGQPGSEITDDSVEVGEAFFVEIRGREFDPAYSGLARVALDIAWDPDLLTEIDVNFSPADVITPNLPVLPTGILDQELGTITNLGGSTFLNAGRTIGDTEAETFATLHFRANEASSGTLLTITQGWSQIVARPAATFSNSRLRFETQTITVVDPASQKLGLPGGSAGVPATAAGAGEPVVELPASEVAAAAPTEVSLAPTHSVGAPPIAVAAPVMPAGNVAPPSSSPRLATAENSPSSQVAVASPASLSALPVRKPSTPAAQETAPTDNMELVSAENESIVAPTTQVVGASSAASHSAAQPAVVILATTGHDPHSPSFLTVEDPRLVDLLLTYAAANSSRQTKLIPDNLIPDTQREGGSPPEAFSASAAAADVVFGPAKPDDLVAPSVDERQLELLARSWHQPPADDHGNEDNSLVHGPCV